MWTVTSSVRISHTKPYCVCVCACTWVYKCACDWQVYTENWWREFFLFLCSTSLIHPSPFLLSSIHFSFSFSAFLPLRSRFVLNCWREIARNGISGSIADILKALRIPVPASPSQPAMPHGDIPASKPQIFPSFFASLPFSLSLFLRWHFQQLRMFKLHISASLRSLKAFHRF